MNADFVTMLRPFLKYAGAEDITPETRLRDVGLDSMQEIELLFAIEDTYGVVLPDDQLNDTTFETGASLWAAIDELRTPTEADVV